MEKLAQLNPQTGLGPLSKSRSKPFEPKVRTHYISYEDTREFNKLLELTLLSRTLDHFW